MNEMNLRKRISTLSDDERRDALAEIINNENVIIDALDSNEIFAVFFFRELKKAFKDVVLNCNYAHTKHADDVVNEYRLDIADDAHIHFYAKAKTISVCTTCKKLVREQRDALDALAFKVKYNDSDKIINEKRAEMNDDDFNAYMQTLKAKTIHREAIAYDEIAEVTKQLIAIIESVFKAKIEK